jgi:hypothetical protein
MPGYNLPLQLTPARAGSGANQAGVLLCPGSTYLLMQVRTPQGGVAGSVSYQLGHGLGAAPQWETDVRFLPPGTMGRPLACDAVRVWSMDPTAPQYVAIEAD